MRRLIFIIFTGILIVNILNCEKENPIKAGYSDIIGDREGNVIDTTLVQVNGIDTFFPRFVNNGTAESIYLGNYENYRSAIYLKFIDFPDSCRIHSAKLQLIVRTRIGPSDTTFWDQSHQFTLNLHLAKSDWDYELDPEELTDLPFSEPPFQTASIVSDSNIIEIELDSLIVNEWADTNSSQSNYGMWISSTDAEYITSFYSWEIASTDYIPKLIIGYDDMTTTETTLDTTTVYVYDDASHLTNTYEELNIDENYLYCGKGLAFRSFVKFDIQNFDTTLQIHRAQLKLTKNAANSFNNLADIYDCMVYRLDEESWEKGTVNELPETASYSVSIEDSTLIFDVTPTVQSWIGNAFVNYGFLIRSSTEDENISRTAIYSSKSNAELQPKLVIYYKTPAIQDF